MIRSNDVKAYDRARMHRALDAVMDAAKEPALYAIVGSSSGVREKGFASKDAAKERLVSIKASENFGRAGGIWKGTDRPQTFKIMKYTPGESDAAIRTRFWGQ